MKRNIVLSSVAAVAVAGMLVLSGCGGNSGSSNDNTDDAKSNKISVVVGKDGKVSSTKPATISYGSSKKDHGQDDVSVGVKSVKCSSGTDDSCEDKCTTEDPCEVKVETGCGVVANNTLVDSTSAQAANDAFAELAGSGEAIAADEFVGFNGVTVLTSDDVDSCTIDYSAFIVCSLDVDGKKYYVMQGKPGTDETGAQASEVLVEITTVDENGNPHTEWKRVPLEWKTKNGVTGQPFVNLENLALNGNLPATIKIFTLMKKDGAKSHGNTVTGVSGATGLSGAGA